MPTTQVAQRVFGNMALTQGSLNIIFLLQKVFLIPIHLVSDHSRIKLIRNLTFHKRRNLYYLISTKLYILLSQVFSLGKIYWLLVNWTYRPDFQQLGYHILVAAVTLIGAAALHCFENFADDFCFLITQRFKLVQHNFHGKCKVSNKTSTKNNLEKN